MNPLPDSSESPAAPPPPEPRSEASDPAAEPAGDPEAFKLPEPDPDNITVLTKKLPNKPILPWNRYDSPGQEEETGAAAAEEEAPPPSTEPEQAAIAPRPGGMSVTPDDPEDVEVDEVE